MRRTAGGIWCGVTIVAAFWLVGCARIDLDPSNSDAVELEHVGFFPDTTQLCGPAALATVLAASDVDVELSTLTRQVFLPGRQGTLQAELLAATRRYDRIALPVAPTLSALIQNLRDGRSTLILQQLGFGPASRWHYAVVVGYLPSRNRFVLRSGAERRLELSAARLDATWRRAGRWGFSLVTPDVVPATAGHDDFVAAVTALEAAGRLDAAAEGYRAALGRWPDSRLARLGLANTEYARGSLPEAARLYAMLVDADPSDLVAANNLAQTLADRGCPDAAREVISRSLARSEEGTPLHQILLATGAEIEAAAVKTNATSVRGEGRDPERPCAG